MHGKCPKCEKQIITASYSTPDITRLGGQSWKGVSINCPHCQTVLSISIDPIAIKSDIVASVKKLLGR
jgi:hypothetical protein